MIHLSRRSSWRGLALAVLAVLLIFMATSAAFKGHIDDVAGWSLRFAQSHPFQGAIIFVLSAAASAMLAFASSAILVPPATVVWGKLGAFLLLWGGWTLGAVAAYGLGRLATPLLIRLGYGKKLVKYQQFVSGKMRFWSVLIFCIAVPSEVPGYLFGSAHYPFGKFIAAIGISEAIYAVALVVIGERLLAMRPSIVFIGVGILIVGAVAVASLMKRPSANSKPLGRLF